MSDIVLDDMTHACMTLHWLSLFACGIPRYAVISSDGAGTRTVIAAGSDAGSDPSAASLLTPGNCMRINTGGPVPDGADAVVQVEDTNLAEKSADGKGEKTVEILVDPRPGLDIRSRLTRDFISLHCTLRLGKVQGQSV